MSYWQSTPAADAFLARLAMAAVDELKLGQRAPRLPRDQLLGARHHRPRVRARQPRGAGRPAAPRSDDRRAARRTSTRRSARAATWSRSPGDHGVAPLPERRKSRGEDGGRVNLKPLAIELDAALSARWGKGTYVSRILYTDIYFAPGVYARLEKDAAAMAEVVGIVERTPGVAKAFRTRSDRGGAGARRRSGAGGAAPQPGARSQRRPVPGAAAVLDHEPHRDDARLAAALRSRGAGAAVRRRHQGRALRRAGVAGGHRADARGPGRRADAEDRRPRAARGADHAAERHDAVLAAPLSAPRQPRAPACSRRWRATAYARSCVRTSDAGRRRRGRRRRRRRRARTPPSPTRSGRCRRRRRSS